MKRIYCYDFDGTLTRKDTLLEFIKYTMGTARFIKGFLLYSPLIVLMKLHLYSNGKTKEKIFKYFFEGIEEEAFNEQCMLFALEHTHDLRFPGIFKIQEAQRQKEQVFIVSASIDNWVIPFFQLQGLTNVTVLGTQLETKDGKLTGRFKTKNCYGREKVRRICEALSLSEDKKDHPADFDRSQYYIEAFGDSRGDKEMLAFADEGHYKPFR